jgi:hypothetical protein
VHHKVECDYLDDDVGDVVDELSCLVRMMNLIDNAGEDGHTPPLRNSRLILIVTPLGWWCIVRSERLLFANSCGA